VTAASAWRLRLVSAAALGLAGIAACGAAASGGPDGHGDTPYPAPRIGEPGQGPIESELGMGDASPAPDRGDPAHPGAAAARDGGDGGPPGCPYGPVDDPHHGFVRCRTAEEADAGWQPPSQAPFDGGSPGSEAGPGGAAAGVPALVEIGAPVFEGGDVKTAEKALTGLSKDIARCVTDHGGLTQKAGSVKLQFLVRARERAEGVEILASKGVGTEAAACVKSLLKNRWVGPPSADPVGVTVTLSFKPAPR
jgi:hypothetical protein